MLDIYLLIRKYAFNAISHTVQEIIMCYIILFCNKKAIYIYCTCVCEQYTLVLYTNKKKCKLIDSAKKSKQLNQFFI